MAIRVVDFQLEPLADVDTSRIRVADFELEPLEARTIGSTSADAGRSLLRGSIAIPQSAVGLVDLAAKANPLLMPITASHEFLSRQLGGDGDVTLTNALKRIGVDFAGAKEQLKSYDSDALQAARANVQQAEGFGGTVSALARNPSVIVDTVLESAPGMLAGSAVVGQAARGIVQGAVQQALKSNATQEAAALAGQQALQQASKQLMALAAATEGAQSAGQQAADASQGGLTMREALAATGAGVGTALIGRAMSGLGGSVETALGTGGAVGGLSGGAIARGLKGAIGEGTEEALQSGQEQVFSNIGAERPWSEGVSEAAATGLLSGGLMGGPTAAAVRNRQNVQAPTQTPEPVVMPTPDNVRADLDSSLAAGLGLEAPTPTVSEVDVANMPASDALSAIASAPVAEVTPVAAPQIDIDAELNDVSTAIAPLVQGMDETTARRLETYYLAATDAARSEPERLAGLQGMRNLLGSLTQPAEATNPQAVESEGIAANQAEMSRLTEAAAQEVAPAMREAELDAIQRAGQQVRAQESEAAAVQEAMAEPAQPTQMQQAMESAGIQSPATQQSIAIQPGDVVRTDPNTGEEVGAFSSKTSANLARSKLNLNNSHIAVPVEVDGQQGWVLRPSETKAQYVADSQRTPTVASTVPTVASSTPTVGLASEQANRYEELDDANVLGGKQSPRMLASREVVTPELTATGPSVAPENQQVAGRRAKEVDLYIAPMRKRWAGGPQITVVQSTADLPKGTPLRAGDDKNLRGLYFPKSKRAYLIADNLPDLETASQILAHEVMGHDGVRAIVPEKELTPMLIDIYNNNAQIKQAADRLAKKWKYTHTLSIEEAIAEYTEGNFDKAMNLSGIKKLIASVRSWLRKQGFVRKWSDNDILALLANADKYLRDARNARASRTEQATPDEELRASRAEDAPQQITLQAETTAQTVERKVADDMNRFRVIKEAALAQGGFVNDRNDFQQAAERYSKRVSARIEDFMRNEVEPLVTRAAKANISLDDVELYMYASHAQERNAAIAKINPRFPDGGSGMTNARAQELLAEFQALADFAELKSIADGFQALTMRTLQEMALDGVISLETLETLRNTYSYYVPLKGNAKVDEAGKPIGSGSGFSTAGKALKRALGRASMASDIIPYIVQDREKAITAGEKSLVGKTMAQFILDNPNEELWSVDRLPKEQYLATEKLSDATVEELFKAGIEVNNRRQVVRTRTSQFNPEEEFRFFVNGEAVRVRLNDELAIRAYNMLGRNDVQGFLKPFAVTNSFLRQMWTVKNPSFFLINPIRDLQSGSVKLLAEGGTKLVANSWKNYPSAMKAAWQYISKKEIDPAWKDVVRDYRMSGGGMGFARIGDIENQTRKLNELIERSRGFDSILKDATSGKVLSASKRLAWRAINNQMMDIIENLSFASENALRLASYKAAVDMGMTKNEAGRIARHATVNFNRRGEWGPVMNSLWLFSNANIQGNNQMFDALVRDPHRSKAWAAVGGIALLGFLGGLMTDDEEDDLIADTERQRNFVIPLPNGERITIPLAYGWSWFADIGRSMARMYKTDNPARTAQQETLRVLTAFMDNFSPFGNPAPGGEGSAESALVTLTPTAVKPFVMSTVNLNSFGQPLMPDRGPNDTRPDSQKAYRKTRGTAYDQVAQLLNESTGGDQFKEGWIDVSPETIKNFVNYSLGGVGRFFGDSAGLVSAGLSDDIDVESPENVPIVKAFYKRSDISDVRRDFMAKAKESESEFDLLKNYAKAGLDAKVEDQLSKKQTLIEIGATVDAYMKAIKGLNEAEDAIKANETISEADRKAQLKQIEEQQLEVMNSFRAMYRERIPK